MSSYPNSIPRCQHIKTNGTQCGSPALHRRRFCFFHNRWREQHAAGSASPLLAPQAIELPLLEDANSIQIALMQVMRLILRGQLEPKTAGLLLYALQTASLNLRNTDFEPRCKTEVVIDPRDVPSVPLDEDQWNPDDFEEEEETDDDESESEDDDDNDSDDETDDEEVDNEGTQADDDSVKKRSAQNAVTRKPTSRWVPPPGSGPLSERTKAELRVLNEWVELIAPLPPGETE